MALRRSRSPEWVRQALEQWTRSVLAKTPQGASAAPGDGTQRESDLPPQIAKVISLILSLMAALYALAWFAGWLQRVLPL
jgi:hypothetical protein